MNMKRRFWTVWK